jgi:DNA-binding MarR family transcriptional regulator
MARSIPANQDLAAEVADLLHHVNHTIRRQAMAETGPDGPTDAERRTMRTLHRHANAPMRMSELADALGIARRSATSVVDGLEELQLVERIDDPQDRRAVLVQLTAAGRREMAEVARRRRTVGGRVLGSLSRSDLEELRSLLLRVGFTTTPASRLA